MNLSVLIVNYNTSELLERCLKSVFRAQLTTPVEVLVADCNSTDGSVNIIRDQFPSVTLHTYTRNVGFTRPLNRLLKEASADFYLLLHPDVELFPDTIQQLLDFLQQNPQAGLVGANLYYPDGTPNPCEILYPSFRNDLVCFVLRLVRKLPVANGLATDYNPLEWSHLATARVNWVWNACMLVRKEVIDDTGGFDEDFFVWYADWDLGRRAADFGWQSYYLHSARAIHYESQSFAADNLPTEAVRYKIDGWQSASLMIPDRHTFVKKHCPESLIGIKAVDIVQNTLRLALVLGRSMKTKTRTSNTSLILTAYKDTIRAILG